MPSKLIYASRAPQPMSAEELTAILATARRKNEERGITGLLLYCNQSFLQILEGETEQLDALYASIKADPRHCDLRLLTRAPISVRKFPTWSMGFEHVDEDSLASSLPGFKPATEYPLVNAELVRNGAVAEALLDLYQRNNADA